MFDVAALRIVMHMNIVALGAAVVVSTISMLFHGSTNAAEYLVLLMHVFFLAAFVVVLRDLGQRRRAQSAVVKGVGRPTTPLKNTEQVE